MLFKNQNYPVPVLGHSRPYIKNERNGRRGAKRKVSKRLKGEGDKSGLVHYDVNREKIDGRICQDISIDCP